MKTVLFVAASAALWPVRGNAGEISLRPGRVEVVAAADAPEATLLAVQEMTNALSSVFGVPVPVRRGKIGVENGGAKDGLVSIILGDNVWSREAGIDVSRLKRDGFRIVAKGNRIFIAGRDDPQAKVLGTLARGADSRVEQATANGVYEFLERYAGCRFYFPGPLGTIFPRAAALKVPEGGFSSEPDFIQRYHSTHVHGALPETVVPASEREHAIALQERRWRMQTEKIPCCHGQYLSKLPQRFAKTHPEYFRLNADGTRCDTDTEKPPLWNQAHVCLTSDVWEEIYRDARSYLKGEPASVRGMLRGSAPNYRSEWSWHAVGRKYYDVMPQDGLAPCRCARCQTAIAKAKDPKDWANELVWGHTVDIAKRLKAEGIPGYVTQMAYRPYLNVPEVEIPDNVMVMVAPPGGPWGSEADRAKGRELVRAWGEKTHGTVWIWTYVCKSGTLEGTTDWIPCGTPRAMGRYWKSMRGLVFGGFAEDETDRYLHHYLDLYVFSKVCWDLGTDVEALLAEHDRLMFGAAAKPMGGVIRIMEECWKRVARNTVETAVGPVRKAPSDETLFTQCYGPKAIARLDALYAEAESLVPADSPEAKRIALYKSEYYAVLRQRAMDYAFVADVPRWREIVRAHPQRVVRDRFFAQSCVFAKDADGRGFSLAPKEGANNASVTVGLPAFEYGKRYRLSWFLKPEDVKAANAWGGCLVTFASGKDRKRDALRAPRSGAVLGTSDWIHQAIEFTPAESVKAEGVWRTSLTFHLCLATGRVSVRDILVEDLP